MRSDGTYAYTYDAEGNRTANFIDGDLSGHVSAGDTDVTLYEWDHRNRLVKVTTQATQGTNDKIVDYEYDVFNNRVAKHIDTDANGASDRDEFYVYDLDDPADLADVVLDFVDADGAGVTFSPDLATRYLHGNAVDQLLAQEDATGTGSSADITWPLSDHLGTIRDLVDSTGALVTGGHLTYDSFGNLTGGDASLNRYQFTGREWDPDAELFYYRARWYDAATGRFISEDPIGFASNDTNLSRYVGNSPVLFTDPSGLMVASPKPWNAGKSKYATNFWNSLSEYVRAALLAEGYTCVKWEVHHLFQQAVAKWFFDETGKSVHLDKDNLILVPDFVHDEINRRQAEFWEPFQKELAKKTNTPWNNISLQDVVDSGLVSLDEYETFIEGINKEYAKYSLPWGAGVDDVKALTDAFSIRDLNEISTVGRCNFHKRFASRLFDLADFLRGGRGPVRFFVSHRQGTLFAA